MLRQKNQLAGYHGYWCLHLFCVVEILFVATSADFTKKVVHFDHSGNHEESLCWAVKLKENHGDLTELQGGEHSPPPRIRLVSLGQISEFPNHIAICHRPRNATTLQVPNFKILHQFYRHLYEVNHKKFAQIKHLVEMVLETDTTVEWFSPYVVRRRQKRSVHFQDPYFPRQWHLVIIIHLSFVVCMSKLQCQH